MGYEQKVARQEAPLVVNKEGKLFTSTSKVIQEKKETPPEKEKTITELKQEIQEIKDAKNKLEYAKLYNIPPEALVDDISPAGKDISALQAELQQLKQNKRKGILGTLRSFFTFY